MSYTGHYDSPLGRILLAADETGLCALCFEGQRHIPSLQDCREQDDHPVLVSARKWLDIYFDGKEPAFLPPLHMAGTTFQQAVWRILLTIPYGTTVTYGAIANKLSVDGKRMAAQAVGGAVGRNPVSLIVPCHRVVGANGALVGYGGGMERKRELLLLEGIGSS